MDFTTKTAVAHVAFAEMMKCVIKSLGTVSMAVNQTIRIRFVKVTLLDTNITLEIHNQGLIYIPYIR